MAEEINGVLDSMDALRRSIIQLIQGLDEDDLNWNPLPGELNSLYSLASHLCVGEKGIIHGRVGGLESERLIGREQLDGSLKDKGAHPQTLIDMIEAVGLKTREILGQLTDDKIGDPIEDGTNRPRSARWWIHLNIRHMSSHLGHMEIMKQFHETGIVRK